MFCIQPSAKVVDDKRSRELTSGPTMCQDPRVVRKKAQVSGPRFVELLRNRNGESIIHARVGKHPAKILESPSPFVFCCKAVDDEHEAAIAINRRKYFPRAKHKAASILDATE